MSMGYGPNTSGQIRSALRIMLGCFAVLFVVVASLFGYLFWLVR